MIKLRNGFQLSSHKIIYANKNLVSISYTEKGYAIYEGYDGMIYLVDWNDKSEPVPQFTKEELLELATHVMNQWNDFKMAVLSGKVPVQNEQK